MKIRDLYKAILQAVGAVVHDDGLVSMVGPDGDLAPFRVSDKRLAMPTDELLNRGAFNPDGSLIAFHPICENVVLDPSPVLEKLELAMTYRLTTVLRELIQQLTAVAADPKQHKKLKMKAHGLLSALPDADERTKNDFIKIMEHTSTVGQKKLISLYVRSGGLYGGEKVSRLGRFFPTIVDALDQEKRSLHGVSLRKADVPAFLALIEYLLPDYRDADKYSAPSNALVAPMFQALCKTFIKVANQLNRIIDIHAAQLENPDALRIDTDWADEIQDLSKYRELIPVLPGNDGKEGTKTAKVTPAKAPIGQPAKAAASPARTGAEKSKGGISVDELIRGITPPRPNFGGFQTRQAPAAQTQRGWARQPQQAAEELPPWARTGQTTTFGSGGGWSGRGGSGYGGGSL